MAKLSKNVVIEIYHSEESKEFLCSKYNISNNIINGIKTKRYYNSITSIIDSPPGKCKGDIKILLSREQIREIYKFEGTILDFKLKFSISITVVRNIKSKYTYIWATNDLDNPGEIYIHKLTWKDIQDIRLSDLSNRELSLFYKVCKNTISNIRNRKTRLYR